MAQFSWRTMLQVGQIGGQQTFEALLGLVLGEHAASKSMLLQILLDVSASTEFTQTERLVKDNGGNGLTVLAAINQVLPEIVKWVRPQDCVGVWGYSDPRRPVEIIPLTEGSRIRQHAARLGSIRSAGSTHMTPAFERAIQVLTDPKFGGYQKVLLIVGDGDADDQPNVIDPVLRSCPPEVEVKFGIMGEQPTLDAWQRLWGQIRGGTSEPVIYPVQTTEDLRVMLQDTIDLGTGVVATGMQITVEQAAETDTELMMLVSPEAAQLKFRPDGLSLVAEIVIPVTGPVGVYLRGIVDTPASEVETDVVLFPRVQATWTDANGQPQSLAGGPFSMKFGPEEKGLDTAMQNLVRTAEATWKRVQAMALAKTNPGKSVVLLGQSANLFLAAGATDAAAAANNMASVIKSGSQMKAVDAGRSAMLARKAAAASFDDL